MTNPLDALVDRFLDVTLAHLFMAREHLANRRSDGFQSFRTQVPNREHVAAGGYQIARERRSQDGVGGGLLQLTSEAESNP